MKIKSTLNFIWYSKSLSKVVVPMTLTLYTSLEEYEYLLAPHPQWHLELANFSIFANLVDVKNISLWFQWTLPRLLRKVNSFSKAYCPFIVHLLWTACSYPLPIYMLMCLFLFVWGSSLSIPDIIPLSITCIANIFPHVMNCHLSCIFCVNF